MRAVDLLAVLAHVAGELDSPEMAGGLVGRRSRLELLWGTEPGRSSGISIAKPWSVPDGRTLFVDFSIRLDTTPVARWEISLTSDSDAACEQVLWSYQLELSGDTASRTAEDGMRVVLTKLSAILRLGLPPDLM